MAIAVVIAMKTALTNTDGISGTDGDGAGFVVDNGAVSDDSTPNA